MSEPSVQAKPLSAKKIARRIEEIQQLDDPKKAKSHHRKLMQRVMSGIADGSITDARECASLVMSVTPAEEQAD